MFKPSLYRVNRSKKWKVSRNERFCAQNKVIFMAITDSYIESNGDDESAVNGSQSAVGQSFTGNGQNIGKQLFKKLVLLLVQQQWLQKYMHILVLLVVVVTPTGSALATSDTVNISVLNNIICSL